MRRRRIRGGGGEEEEEEDERGGIRRILFTTTDPTNYRHVAKMSMDGCRKAQPSELAPKVSTQILAAISETKNNIRYDTISAILFSFAE